MPRKSRRRPLAWAIPVVAILVFLAASALRQISLGGEAARRSIASELGALTGLPVTFGGGRPEFRLLPMPRLVVEEVVIGSREKGPRLTIAGMTADLDLWAALLGRTEIDRLVLLAPALSVPPGTAPDTSLRKTFAPFLSRLHGLGDVEIRDGVLSGPNPADPAIVSAANLNLSWPQEAAAASLSGTYSWNGQPVRLGFRLAAPQDWLEGRSSTVDFDMTSPQLDLAFDGTASADRRLSGRLQASLPSLSRSLRWLGDRSFAVPEIGPLSIAADVASEGDRLSLSNASVTVDGFAGRGALDLVFPADRRPSLGGTLAFERLDLDGLAQALAPLPQTPFEAARPISVGFVRELDIDLRVSAGEGRIGALALTDLAGTVKLTDGVATLDIGDTGLLGGNGQMRVAIDTRTAPPALKGSASMRGVEAAGLLSALGLSANTLSGVADLSLGVEAPVTNWADIFNRHRVAGTLQIRSGAIGGLDPQALRTAGSDIFDPDSATALPFSALGAEIASVGPRVTLTSLRIRAEGGTIEGSGLLVDAANTADLEGTFEPAADPAADGSQAPALTKPKPISLRMRGTWPHPAILASASADEE
ncbi:AsmA-like C-terminal region-containing protein [Aureimonas sp. Leaf427]|nr:AsmA-like C-terminal region-containing protein [Aureimonas sp. Leaf427]KQT69784.1 hypothetical protein ASG62_01335 [Aureimonas sp. Leaf427]